MKLQQDLREFIELLNSHKVACLIVDGYAVAYHGHPRFTGDIDFFIEASQENATKVVAVLADFGFAGMGIAEKDLLEPGTIVQLGRPPNRIDLVTSISGVEFADACLSARLPGRRADVDLHRQAIPADQQGGLGTTKGPSRLGRAVLAATLK
jgi:hypothetical protein